MRKLLKSLIVDFHEGKLPDLVPRQINFPVLPKGVRKAYVLIGMRRVGKTWMMYQHMQDLLKSGIEKKQLLYINFEDERLLDLNQASLQEILDAYFELYPSYDKSDQVYFFFDEIHVVAGWEHFIRRLLDNEKMQLFISGSSAKMLSKEIATNLRGRAITREVFTYSFAEYLTAKELSFPEPYSTSSIRYLKFHAQAYLSEGGFPEVVNMEPIMHREVLQDYIDIVVYRDVVERYQINNPQIVKRLLQYGLQNSANIFSINKVYNHFKEMGLSLSKNALYDYMDHFDDAYCLYSIPIYNFSLKKTNLKPNKIYPNDTGLITAFTVKDKFESTVRLESMVFNVLRRQFQDIFYYQTKQGHEVDFLILSPEDQIKLMQVSWEMRNEKTKQRELRALNEAMLELGVSEGAIVSFDEEWTLNTDAGRVVCVPLWKFLLGLS